MDQTIVRIAEQLGFQAARIWPQVVMVTWLTSLFWAIMDPILMAASVTGIVVTARKAVAERNRQQTAYRAAQAASRSYVSSLDYDNMEGILATILIVCVLSCVLIAALVAFPDQLAGAVYPEAVTVMRIAKGLK